MTIASLDAPIFPEIGFASLLAHLQHTHDAQVDALAREVTRLRAVVGEAPAVEGKCPAAPLPVEQGPLTDGEQGPLRDEEQGRADPCGTRSEAGEACAEADVPWTAAVEIISGDGFLSDEPAAATAADPSAQKEMMSSRGRQMSVSSTARKKKLKWKSNAPTAQLQDAPLSCRSRAVRFVEGPLELIIPVVILLNVFSVYAELEVLGYAGGISVGAIGGRPLDLAVIFQFIAQVFTYIYVVELALKLLALRTENYYVDGSFQKFNIFDTLVVLICAADAWVISPLMGGSNSSSSLMAVRLVRFFRIFKTLRIVRTFEIFAKLRVLMTTVVASFFALFWSLVLLTTVMLMAALVMCQGATTLIGDPLLDVDFKVWAFTYFGTPSRSMWTIFEWTFGDGWQPAARKLIFEISAVWALFFVVYISGVIFAMTRIITALFLKDTLSAAASDAEAVIADKLKEKTRYTKKLQEFFEAADASGDGYVSWEEFQDILKDEKVVTYLATLELDASASEHLFNMLDDGDRQVAVDEFVRGALRLKGQARSSDVIAVMHDCSRVLRKVDRMAELLISVHDRVHQHL